MRRTSAAVVVALSLAATVLPAGSSYADDTLDLTPPAAQRLPEPEAPTAEQVLDRAEDALEGNLDATRTPDVTMALRDLFAALPRLTGEDRERARAALARPTNGTGPNIEPKYTVAPTKRCNKLICVHWVRSTQHQATDAWARRTLRVMQSVWKKEIRQLGYRRPVKDGRRGGNGKFDVYLADVGNGGYYGYCATERSKPGNRRLASGYCVLDNDFARGQFNARPIDSLRVTAAHEFFHAVQFGYDWFEDLWLMEATATWMEERFADGVDDNRQYLEHGQVRATHTPLDLFDGNGFSQYGNWAFFEYLGKRFGNGIVKRIWSRAGHGKGDGRKYSTEAVKAALPRTSPFRKTYTQFAAANTTPARSYPEGRHWPTPAWTGRGSLGKNERTTGSVRIDHMANAAIRVVPKKALTGRRWKLRVTVDGPARRTSPMAAVVLQKKSGKVSRRIVRLGKAGRGKAVVPFNRRQTKRVFVVLANASTRFDCRGQYEDGYSCGGEARDDDKRFTLKMRTFRRR